MTALHRAAHRLEGGWPTVAALAVLLVAGAWLRLHALGDVPFGFHPDEGHNALDALDILAGSRPAFLPGNNGREPLFMYLMATTLAAWGPTIAAARLAAVASGLAAVVAVYVFTASLPDWSQGRGARVAVVAAGGLALGFWPVAQSRYALRAVLLPAWFALMLWAWWRAVDPGPAPDPTAGHRARHRGWSLGWACCAGVFLAAAAYTHLTGRVLIAVPIASVAWEFVRSRRRWPLAALATTALTAIVLLAPQIAYFRTAPEMTSYRAEQVSLLNPDVNEGDLAGALATNAWHLADAPFLRGDTSWYHNLSRRPIFDPPTAAAFAVGLLLLGIDLAGRGGRRRQSAAIVVFAALVVGAAPSLLSVGAPNYVRLTAAWPAMFAIAGAGLVAGANVASAALLRIAPAGRREAWRVPGGATLILAALVFTGAATARDYFGAYAAAPQVYEAFNGAAVERGAAIARLTAESPLYVSPAIWNQSVIRFLNVANPPPSIDPTAGLVLPPAGDARYAFDPVEASSAAAFAQQWPQADEQIVDDSRGEASVLLLRIPRGDWPVLDTATPREVAGTSFGGYFELVGAEVTPARAAPGHAVTVTLAWRATTPTPADRNFFVHMVAPDGAGIAQWDGPPLDGSYTTDAWRPGETILQRVGLEIPADAPLGEARLAHGWYDWRTGQRLPVQGSAEDAVTIGSVQLAASGSVSGGGNRRAPGGDGPPAPGGQAP